MKRLSPKDDNNIDDANNSSYRYIGLASEIEAGKSKSFSVLNEKGESIDIAVFNIDGQYYAISNTCIHKGAPLSKGFLEEDIVTCAWHGWKYCVRNGINEFFVLAHEEVLGMGGNIVLGMECPPIKVEIV